MILTLSLAIASACTGNGNIMMFAIFTILPDFLLWAMYIGKINTKKVVEGRLR